MDRSICRFWIAPLLGLTLSTAEAAVPHDRRVSVPLATLEGLAYWHLLAKGKVRSQTCRERQLLTWCSLESGTAA
jgi:hypothetical protein